MVLGEQRGIQWLPTKYKGGGFLWLIYRILVCKTFYHNVHFILLLGRWYLKQPFLVWTLTKPSYVVLSRGWYFNKVLCLGELGTIDYHSVYILVSDSFAYRSPLKNSFAQVKREKNLRENCVFYFDTEFGAKKKYSYSYTQVCRLIEESIEWIWSFGDSSESLDEDWHSSLLSRLELLVDVPLEWGDQFTRLR